MRIKYLDNIRALCMIWIVGIWHMSDYCGNAISNVYTQNITYGVLGAFTFLSGVMMGGNVIESLQDFKLFYKKRLLRIYPLFAVSCTSLLLLHYLMNVQLISGVSQYIFTMLGLSIILTPAPGTIWYVSMILLFYILTPFLLYRHANGIKTAILLKSLIIFVFFILLKVVDVGLVDERLYMLFPIYCIGLLTGKEKILNSNCRYVRLLFGVIIFIGINYVETKYVQTDFIIKIMYTILVETAFVMFIMEFGKIFKGNIERCLSKVGYSSMCAYLFHRQFYGLFSKLFGRFSLVEAFMAFGVVIIFCFYIQKGYDLLCKKTLILMERRNEKVDTGRSTA